MQGRKNIKKNMYFGFMDAILLQSPTYFGHSCGCHQVGEDKNTNVI